jgi:hypothetical protein
MTYTPGRREYLVTTSISLFIKWHDMLSKCLVGIACILCYYLSYSPLWAVLCIWGDSPATDVALTSRVGIGDGKTDSPISGDVSRDDPSRDDGGARATSMRPRRARESSGWFIYEAELVDAAKEAVHVFALEEFGVCSFSMNMASWLAWV